jgi:hypothetical protein
MYRTQVLLEPHQHQALSDLAKREGRSVSDLLREFVDRQLAQRENEERADLERRMKALESVRRQRDAILEQRGGLPLDIDVVTLIDEGREDRDERDIPWHDDRR